MDISVTEVAADWAVSTIAAENITFEEQGADEDVWD